MRRLNRKSTNSLLGGFQPDLWLSQQISRPAYRLQSDSFGELPPGPCFCYAKVPVQDVQRSQALVSAGFSVVETLVTYQKQPDRDGVIVPGLREARAGDSKRVQEIAGGAFRFSRFHVDPGFGPAIANRIKAAWARNFFQGQRGHRMLVTEEQGTPAGFILLVEGTEVSAVDLIAVDPAFQGKGLGAALLLAAETKGRRMTAGTQKTNSPSCRMYEKCGYTAGPRELVFHLHR